MAGQNGTATLTGVIRLGDLSPQHRPVSIERDGEEVTLAAYVAGKRCPIPVTIAYNAARQAYTDAMADPSITQADRIAAGSLWVKACLQAVIPGLKDDEANVMAADAELHSELLIQLGWWQRIEAADPEAPAVATTPTSPSTTAVSSPASAPSTTAPDRPTGTPT